MNDTTPEPEGTQDARRPRSLLLRVVLPLLVLGAGVYGAKVMIDTAPKAERRRPERRATLVETHVVEAEARDVVVEAMGTVVAAREMELEPQVGGRVEWVAPELEPGAQVLAGHELVRIERADYELALEERETAVRSAEAALVQAKSRVVQAESDLALERGDQAFARSEFERLKKEVSGEAADILLRKPQLQSALAGVESAKAAVASAEASLRAAKVRLSAARLDLERTTLVAPFNSVVVDRRVEVGDIITSGTTVTRLVGSDAFWVRLSVPQADLPWIDFPEAPEEVGSSARIYDDTAGPGEHAREGHVVRRLPSVDEIGRMARVLVQVEDPLALEEEHAGRWPLLAGSFVRAEIVGARLERVVVVPRRYVRGGDQAWIMNDEDGLEVRELDVLYRSRDEVFVRDGVEEGERLITTDLSAPVPGMSLRTE